MWASFQAQGGERVAPGASLVPGDDAGTLAPPGPEELPLDPATLERVELDGPQADFQLLELIGRGGMGEVHLARERVLGREVAVKTVPRGASTRAVQALLHEALHTGALEHPNVVPLHRVGHDGLGRPVLVMKRVTGTSWHELLQDPLHPTWQALASERLRANLQVLIQVCNAVQHAHERGILHRDVKPANVMVGALGEVYLVDWGAAIRLEALERAPAAIAGTLAYMAPEMLEEPRRLSPRSDVYLLGATLHHVLVGAPRHPGSSHMNVVYRVLRSEPHTYPPGVPRELAALCNRCTAADPQARPASALELRRELERFLQHQGAQELARQAGQQLAALEAELAAESDPSGRRAAELFAACRFGFEQALQAWPESPLARDGLQRCLELSIERELLRRNRGSVEALLPLLPRPRRDLEQRLAALRAELEREAGASTRLAALEHEHDLRVSRRVRAGVTFSAAALCYAAGLGLMLLVQGGWLRFTYSVAFAFGLVVGLIMLLHLLPLRSWLLQNLANRRLVGIACAGWLACMVNVLACWAYDIAGGILILYVGVIMNAVAMQAAVVVDSRYWWAVLLSLLGIFSGVVLPGVDPFVVHAAVGLAIFALIAGLWLRDR